MESVRANQPAPLPRLSMNKLWEDVLGIFDVEKGFIYTFYYLLIRPHWVVHTYLFADRTKLTNPFKFLAVSITLSALVLLKTDILQKSMTQELQQASAKSVVEQTSSPPSNQANAPNLPPAEKQAEVMFQLLNDTFSFAYFLFIPLMGLLSWLPYPRKQLFLGEHIIIHTYVSALWNFILVLAYPLLFVLPELLQPIFVVYLLGYFFSLMIIYKHLSQKSWQWSCVYTLGVVSIGMFISVALYSIFLAVGTFWKLLQAPTT
ncbi:MAG: DUF3667 domain-containing protein [Cytophagales bacterium]|nr:DUF3667 domain-containing protein [Bernardetiaceae bacterium]MDW8204264.1 DUF3667 domain-containing protein [Cytophagales bacterium]